MQNQLVFDWLKQIFRKHELQKVLKHLGSLWLIIFQVDLHFYSLFWDSECYESHFEHNDYQYQIDNSKFMSVHYTIYMYQKI